MDPALRLQPGQPTLTPEQEAYAQQFIETRMAAMLSCAAVDEAEAEAHLRAAYRVAGLEPPQVRWFDSPHAFGAAHVPENERDNQEANLSSLLFDAVEDSVSRVEYDRPMTRLVLQLWRGALGSMKNHLCPLLLASVLDSLDDAGWRWVWFVEQADHLDYFQGVLVDRSMKAYLKGEWAALSQFFHEVFEPNDAIHLASFNELVSGYRLGRQEAWLVRKPIRLEWDEQGRLHSTAGKCMEYADGWGISAWHGVRVPDRVILAPEMLTREDWSSQTNVEARRVMQERMGERFMSVLGGRLIDEGPRGKLYEVVRNESLYEMGLRLGWPGTQDEVERYVEVQDASTSRQYFLRVPPTIQTAAEAVAWSFGLSVEAYHPAQET
ncbi:MAG TPA: hypothetical protein VKT82_24260 [Ktedonobacterales bacterium]|nr:hypothetical protein [Ktedonobacterales bacterium]